MRRASILLAFAALFTAAGRASADSPPAAPTPPAAPAAPTASTTPATPPGDTPAEQVEVRVIGDKADALQKIPGSGTLVTAKEIERAAAYDVAEVLRHVPGLSVHEQEGGGLRLDIGVRGLDPGRARRVLILEDGIPVSVNPYAESDLYYAPPLERMRGIEVVKGSGSILFGPQTIGGVINFLTIAPPASQQATLELDGGQRGYFKALASYGDSFERARYLVQIFHKQGDGFNGEAFNATDVLAKVAIDTSERGVATLKVGFHDEGAVSTDVGFTRAMFQQNPRRQVLAPDDKVALRRYEASLIYDYAFTDLTNLRTLVYAYTTARVWNRQDWSRYPEAGVHYDHIFGDQSLPKGAIYFKDTDTILDRTYDVFGVEPRMEHRFETAGVGHTLDFGARFLAETARLIQRAGDRPDSTSGTETGDDSHRTFAFAAYVQDRIAFRKDLLVTPGVRFEYAAFHRELRRDYVGTGPMDILVPGDSSSSAVVPGIGIVYGSPSAHAFAGLHMGFAPPRITSSISPKGQTVQLDPERSIDYELGARFARGRKLRLEVTGFLSNFQNQIVTGSNSDTGATELVNGGQTRHIGVETGATLGLGDLFKLGVVLDLSGQYTYARATFVGGDTDGYLLPYAPLHTAAARLDFEHPIGAGAQVAWSHVSSQYTDNLDTRSEDVTGGIGQMPAYNVIDVGARYRHKATGLTASVTVKGLLDEVYVAARRPEGNQAGGFRQITAGLRWELR